MNDRNNPDNRNTPDYRNNRWLINRIGLVNYWYYDEEEFEFSGGRLLLRGANGSGKSVTMQSFIPLLLDGNRSPERLDPFGSRARKLEDYLLGEEELGEEERTGYLYMEFLKEESGNYLTLGIGLHARRGKGLDFWSFAITDGRRVGRNFFLYKDLGEKVPLSKQELKNRIGEGGQVHDRQKDYMDMVNNLLFGFESLEDYDELIKLLVQLRTPKLSKDFKPTVIYDILNNSLQPLSDEDLRPMSEAIENMDNIKSQLDHLQESKKAADRLGKEFDRYNRFILWEKARNFLSSHHELGRRERQAQDQEQLRGQYLKQHLDAETKLQELKSSRAALELKQRELLQHDSFRFLREIEERRKTVAALEENQRQKEQQREQKEGRERKLREELRRAEEGNSRLEASLGGILKNMSDLAGQLHFDEHFFMQGELQANLAAEYSWSLLKGELQRYRGRITAARKKLQAEREQNRVYDQAYGELERARREKEDAQANREKAEKLLGEIKEEFVEKVHIWKNGNQLLKPDAETMIHLQRAINAYPEQSYDDLLSAAREVYHAAESRLVEERSGWQAEKANQQERLREKEQELAGWKSKKDPEPPREEKVALNRERLTREGIPYLPFYQAVDFREDLPEELRGRIEEALGELGLLDALIVPEESRSRLFRMDPGMADRYLFPRFQLLTVDLSRWLRPVAPADGRITAEVIDSTVRSLWIEDSDDRVYLTSTGEYGLGGLLKGKVSGACRPKFIGAEARRRYRQEVIDGLQAEIAALQAEIAGINEKIAGADERLQLLQREFKAFPGKDDLETAAATWQEARLVLESAVKLVAVKNAYVDQCYKLLQQIQGEIRELTVKIGIPVNVEAYEEAEEVAGDYADQLRELETGHSRYLAGRQQRSYLEEQLRDLELDLDNLRHDLEQVRRQLGQEREIIQQYREMLGKLDYEAVKQEMEDCLRRLEAIPARIETETRRSQEGETRSQEAEEKLTALSREIGFWQKVREIHQEGFELEYQLGYVRDREDGESGEDLLALARRIGEKFKDFGRENKGREDYGTLLQVRYHDNRQYLSEYNLAMAYLFNPSGSLEGEWETAAGAAAGATAAVAVAEAVPDVAAEKESGAGQAVDEAVAAVAEQELKLMAIQRDLRRLDLTARIQGKDVNFHDLLRFLEESITENEKLLLESDRQLFEDILANTISKKIRARIYNSEQWVKKMNALMEGMDTSSGLSFSLVWKSRVAETEEQLDTRELVDLLKSDANLLRPEDFQKLSAHFRSKIAQARKELEEKGEAQNFHTLMKNILDYRQWFEFQLFFTKAGERRRELTNNAFDKFSGGEKAMAMYVPLFSAVYARYEGARRDCPRLISLDEAFAGVDENNIRDMFRLLEALELNFIINSQSLWGDYDTVPSLAICELVRPNNANFVSVIRYRWNGRVRELAAREAAS
ncbi:MAG: TIGR02680 family protein [Firmicutes bacterium]|nr:TIGR02680 family protein [Bacillota bacterium]